MVLVSVIIPVFNGERTILETLDSVISQTLDDIEIIVINDGSTDRTLEVLSQIQDSRLQVHTHSNSGVAESRNRGIKQAQGEFLAFLDADDLWKKDKLQEQVSALRNNSEAAVAYSWNDFIDESGGFLHHGWHPNFSGDVHKDLIRSCFIENGSNILMKRNLIPTVGEFDGSVSPAEDWDFYLRLAENHKFICVPKTHVLYRISAGSQSQSVLKMERAGTTILKRAFQRSPHRLKGLWATSFSEFYSYLFYRAFKQAPNRRNSWITLSIFCRGVLHSPKLWRLIAKRRLLYILKNLL